MEIKTFKNNVLKCSLNCVNVKGAIWFKAKEVAVILGYSNTNAAIQSNVEDEDKKQMEELSGQSTDHLNTNEKITIYIKMNLVFIV